MTKATDKSIMLTAIELFKKSQFEEVKVDDICAACNITKPTFYYHFKSKDQLISRYFRSLIVQLPQQLTKAFANENALTKIFQFYRLTIDVIDQLGPDLYTQLYISNLKQNQHTFDFSKETSELVIKLIAEAQQQRLVANHSDATELYVNSVLLFEGYEINWCIQNGMYDIFPFFRHGLEVLFEVPEELQTDKPNVDCRFPLE